MSSEESDYELEYDVLSAGSADPWDGTEHEWISATSLEAGGSNPRDNPNTECEHEDGFKSDKVLQPSTSGTAFEDESDKEVVPDIDDFEDEKANRGKVLDLEDLEQMMSEIGNMRSSLRLMPDFQRREMAAKLAMKMASVFGGESDQEEEIESI